MSKTFQILDLVQPSTKAQNVGTTSTVSVVSSRNRLTYSSATGTGKHLSIMCPVVNGTIGGTLGESVLDGEFQCSFFVPNGAGVRQGAFCRAVNYSGSDWRGYFIREVTAGDPTAWEIGTYDTATDVFTSITTITPPGVSSTWGSQEIIIKLSFIASVFRVKIWLGGSTEPSWSVPANTTYFVSTTYTAAGSTGHFAWDLNATGFYIEGAHFSLALINQVGFSVAGSLADTTGTSGGTVFTATNVTLKSGEIAMISILNSKTDALTNANPSSVVCTNLTVSSALVTGQVHNTIAAPANKLHIFSCKATADITNGSLVVTFPAAQTGCAIMVYRCVNALNSDSSGAAAFLGETIAATDTLEPRIPNITLSAFSNPVGVSATVAVWARAVATEALTIPTTWYNVAITTYATPSTTMHVMSTKQNHTLFMADRTDAGCVRTISTPTVTDSAITANDVGKPVTGTGIPASTTIISVVVGVSFTMSANASSSGTASCVLAGNFRGITNSRSALFAAEVQADPWHITEYPSPKAYVGAIPILS